MPYALAFLWQGAAATRPPQIEDPTPHVRQVRRIETKRPGRSPAGIAFSPRARNFLVYERRGGETGSDLLALPLAANVDGTRTLATQIDSPVNGTFDGKANRLLNYEPDSEKLVIVEADADGALIPDSLVSIDFRHLGLRDAQGMAVDPSTGTLYMLDAAQPRILRVEPDVGGGFDGASILEIDLSGAQLSGLRGLALDPKSGHFHILSLNDRTLYEVNGDGLVVTSRDLSDMDLVNPGGMVFAPSGDLTDDPATMSLYIADSGNLDETDPLTANSNSMTLEAGDLPGSGHVLELNFEPVPPPAMPDFVAGLVQTIDASALTPPSPDTAGITYLPFNDTLFFSDSEVNEVAIFTGDNLWEIQSDGFVVDTTTTMDFSNEPTGVAFNPANNHLFVSDDNKSEMYEVEPGPDGKHGTPDDTVTSFDTSPYNNNDPEGVAFDTWQNILFVADGVSSEIYAVSPGANGIFDGVPSAGDDVVTSFDTTVHGVTDPEGIAFNTDNGNLYVVGKPKTILIEVTTAGALVQTIDISAANANKPAGLAYAPGSLNPSAMSIYIVERGIDNSADPNENDGKIYEMTLPQGANVPPVANDDNASTAQDTSVNVDVAANDTDPNANLDPASANTTCVSCFGPSNGGLVNHADGTFTYTPNLTFVGIDTFVYEICDTDLLCDTATVSVDVVPNNPPIASNDIASTLKDTPVDIDVAVNDTDPNGNLDPASANIACTTCAAPADGTLVNNVDGTFTYTPDPGFVGSDGFVYEICDTEPLCDTATVTIDVSAFTTIYVSSSTTGVVNGLAFDDEDILAHDLGTGAWSMYFDGSDVGWTANSLDVDAFHLNNDGTILLSTNQAATLPDVGAVEDADIVRFVPTSTGINTAGTYEWYFDGSDVELTTTGEDIDAIGFTPDGDLVISTRGSFSVTNVAGSDEDLLRFIPTSLGATTSGTWQLYFDGSDVQLDTASSEDVAGTWVRFDEIFLSTRGAFSVTGASGDGADIFTCLAASTGSNTSCTYSLFWDGSANGFAGETISGFAIGTAASSNNDPPTISDIADQTVLEDTSTGTIPFTVDDTETAPAILTLAGSSSDPTLVPNANIVFGGSGANRTVDVTPASNQSGAATITVTVSDGTDSTNDTFLLTVTAVNDPPTISNIADQTTPENIPTPAIPFTIGDVETAAGSLTVTGSSDNQTLVPDGNIVLGGADANRTVTITPAANQTGTATITCTVSDGTDSTIDTFLLTVSAVTNVPPTPNDDNASTIENTPVLVDVAFNDTDPNGNLDPASANTSCATCTAPTSGNLVNNANGTFTYTPNPAFVGIDGFVYEICDTEPLCATAAVTIDVSSATMVLEIRVAASEDDAEERADNSMDTGSSDLEMVFDQGGNQMVGMRFNGVSIPQGSTVHYADIQFQVDETPTNVASLTIEGELVGNAPAFNSAGGNISSRARTTASVSWSPPPWATIGEAGPDQKTPNVASVIQEIVDGAGWSSGNSLAIIVSGTGERVAESFDGVPAAAPLLHVEFTTGTGPMVGITTPVQSATFNQGYDIPFTATATDIEDGDVTASLSWVSDLDGTIGNGPSFTRSDLSVGVHTITATATDSDGKAGSHQIMITNFAPNNVLVGAGDIAGCDRTDDEATADLLDTISGTVITLGDNVYPDGTDEEFANCYDPSWGRHKARTRPSSGNHEYNTPGATGYFNYFGAAAGNPGEGWYSYDVANWHIIVLDSECSAVGGCGFGSPQAQWLQADLAANPNTCTLAMFHRPLFSSGNLSTMDVQDFWQILYDAGTEVILSGHEHFYERFAPQDPNGVADPVRGIRQFIVGTGGRGSSAFGTIAPNSEVADPTFTQGVIKLTLNPASYDWEFIPVAGGTFTDSGTGACFDVSNQPPVANDDTVSTPEDTPITADVAANDSDPDGNLDPTSANTTCATCSNPANGTLVNHADGTFTYTPNPDFSGTDSFVYEICDSGPLCDTATVNLTVDPVNDPPTVSDITNQTTAEDTPTSAIPFTVGDVETPPASLIVTGSSSDQTLVPDGNIVLGGTDANRTVTITPAANQTGTATITCTVSDGTDSTIDTFLLTVSAVNDPPTISDIPSQTTAENTATAAIPFTVGDIETAAGALTVTGSSSNQTLVPDGNILLGGGGANRTVTVTPAANESGTATITVIVDDGTDTSNDTFLLTVTAGPNDPPTISDIGDETIAEDTSTAAIPFVVGDTESPAGSLTVAGNSNNQTLVPNANIVFGGSDANRTVTVTPAANESGTATITVTVSDGADSTDDTFLLTVTAVNDPPTVSDISDTTTAEDTATVAIPFTVGDVETAAAGLSVTGSSNNQTLAPNANIVFGGSDENRTVTVTPAANETGTATITVSVSDGTDSTIDTFLLTVTAVNDPPTISNIGDQTTVESTATGAIPFTVDDLETAAGSLTVTGSSDNQALVPDGNIAFGGVDANRTVTVTPAASQSGMATITVTVSDGTGSANDTFLLTVTPVNDPPVANGDNASTVENTPVNVDVAFNDIDLDGNLDPASANTACATCTVPPNGTLVNNTDGTFTYTPNAAFLGSDGFVYQICDTEPLCDTAAVTIDVSASTTVLDIRVAASEDDAEERASGSVNLTSSDLEMVFDQGGDQAVGMRFNGVSIPPGSTVSYAYIQFQVDETPSNPTSLTIEGELAGNAAAFASNPGDISTRTRTTASVGWSPSPWSTRGEAGPDQQTPNIASVIQEIVSGGGWSSGNSLVVIVTGTGERVAESFDGVPDAAPLLHVEFTSQPNDPPTITDIADQTEMEDTGTGAISFTVGDTETPAGGLILTGSSDDQTLVPDANIVFGGSGANRTVSVSPAQNQSGAATITVTVSDGIGSADDTFLFTVTAVNDPPTISDIADQMTPENISTAAIPFTIGDVETAAGSLTVTGSSDNQTLVPNSNIVLDGADANRTVTITPAANQTGTATITCTVSDGTDSTIDTFLLTVTAVTNGPPTANDDNASTFESTPVNVDVAFNDTDLDGNLDPASANTACATCTVPANGTLVNNTDGTFTYTPNPAFVGNDGFVYQICDTEPLCDTATVTIDVSVSTTVLEIRVAASEDDAEERIDGSVSLTSSDLEMVLDRSGDQTVGMRFNGVTIPAGSTVSSAYIQFQVDETPSDPTSLTIEGELAGNAAAFTSNPGDISIRTRTTASVGWSPPPWPTRGVAGPDQQTPNIAPVIQEIVDGAGWSSGNSLVVIITGTGERVAESYNGDPNAAALLHVEFTSPPP